jgi:group I intron endonuclease
MEDENMQGVYQIRNIKNNKIYIGSSMDIEQRWKMHKNDLRRNKHINYKLQNDWNKYGENSFVFEILEINDQATREEISLLEQKYIDELKPYENGYNILHTVNKVSTKKEKIYNERVDDDLGNFYVKKTIRRIGNSLGLNLPSDMLKAMGLKEGDDVYVSMENGEIIIRNTSQKKVNDYFKERVLAIIEEYMKKNKEPK